ncbi:MAG: hypothetical protein F6K35_38590, partial [Okeania sp. SIO2H7]|nr:hypothetical protein [Okeania sp. SIO2H7]
MAGRMVGTKLKHQSKKSHNNTSKIVDYLKKNSGQLFSQKELSNSLKLDNNSCFHTAYHNGYVLRVKRNQQYFYFYPKPEDIEEVKKQFQNTRDEQNPEKYDQDKQNKLLDNYANKYLNTSGSESFNDKEATVMETDSVPSSSKISTENNNNRPLPIEKTSNKDLIVKEL